jgi:hypothetical protein
MILGEIRKFLMNGLRESACILFISIILYKVIKNKTNQANGENL